MSYETILVLDDDPNFRTTLCDILTASGFNPVPFAEGQAAIEWAEENSASVALIDLELGDISGLEAAWLKRDDTVVYVRESATAMRDEAGNTLYYEGQVENITGNYRRPMNPPWRAGQKPSRCETGKSKAIPNVYLNWPSNLLNLSEYPMMRCFIFAEAPYYTISLRSASRTLFYRNRES